MVDKKVQDGLVKFDMLKRPSPKTTVELSNIRSLQETNNKQRDTTQVSSHGNRAWYTVMATFTFDKKIDK